VRAHNWRERSGEAITSSAEMVAQRNIREGKIKLQTQRQRRQIEGGMFRILSQEDP